MRKEDEKSKWLNEVIDVPILYECTDKMMKERGKLLELSPDIGSGTALFLAGVVTGFILLPIALPVIGFQVTKRWGSPK